MDKKKSLEEYQRLFSKLPKRVKDALTEEGNLSKKDIIEQINLYVVAHKMDINVPNDEIEKLITNNQNKYISNIEEHTRENAANYMFSLMNVDINNEQEVLKITNDSLKIIYSIIGKVYNSKYFELYEGNLKKDIVDILININSQNSNINSYEEKIKHIVNEAISKIALQSGYNVSNRLTSGYVSEIKDAAGNLVTSMEMENAVVKK